MPQLKQAVEDVQKFYLPSTENEPEEKRAWVMLNVGELLAGDMMDSLEDDSPKIGTISGRMLATRIREWNFTKPDGTLEPITYESVRRMEPGDLTFLLSKLSGLTTDQLSDDQKKS